MISTLLIAALGMQSTLPNFVEKIPGMLETFKMVRIPDGSITIDGKTTQIKNLCIGETEVTWDIYDIFAFFKDQTQEEQAKRLDAESHPSRPYGNYDRGFGHEGHPAVGVAYNGANMFCAWLSKKTGHKYRLPTDAEWQYAAAASSAPPADLDKVAWYKKNAQGATHVVAKKEPNAWGLFDTLGNANEWVFDPKGIGVTRGGCYDDEADVVNLTARVPYSPAWQEEDAQFPKSKWWLSNGPFVGLRVVCDAP